MNNAIKELNAKLKLSHSNAAAICEKLQKEYSKVFDDSKELAKAIANAEQSSEYQFDDNGEIESWFRYPGLSDIAEDSRDYFETWLNETHNMRVDWKNDCLLFSQGESLVIQDDTRGDNGVWLDGKIVVAESDYRDDDGDVDESKRNALIEAYMEKTGYFPGVFRVDHYGNVSYVSTKAGAK